MRFCRDRATSTCWLCRSSCVWEGERGRGWRERNGVHDASKKGPRTEGIQGSTQPANDSCNANMFRTQLAPKVRFSQHARKRLTSQPVRAQGTRKMPARPPAQVNGGQEGTPSCEAFGSLRASVFLWFTGWGVRACLLDYLPFTHSLKHNTAGGCGAKKKRQPQAHTRRDQNPACSPDVSIDRQAWQLQPCSANAVGSF